MMNHFSGIAVASKFLLDQPVVDLATNLCGSIGCENQNVNLCYLYDNKLKNISHGYHNKSDAENYSFDKENLEYDLQIIFSKKRKFVGVEKPKHDNLNEPQYTPFEELMRPTNMYSFFLCPIFNSKKRQGLLTFEKCEKTNWTLEELRPLKLLSKNMGVRKCKDSNQYYEWYNCKIKISL